MPRDLVEIDGYKAGIEVAGVWLCGPERWYDTNLDTSDGRLPEQAAIADAQKIAAALGQEAVVQAFSWDDGDETVFPFATVAPNGTSSVHPSVRACRVCGCTDTDCRGCIERTGYPCQWIEADLCSACQNPAAVVVAIKEAVHV